MKYNNNLPIYMQIMDKIKKDIVLGNVQPGEKLPSTKQLAQDSQVNPNTIARVYRELEREEVTFTQRGVGTYVTKNEGVRKKLQEIMAGKVVQQFLQGMKELGFSLEEMQELIQREKEKEE